MGNRLTQTIDGNTINYAYNNLDQLLSTGTQSYTYDGRGNLISTFDSSTSEMTTYTFDALDRMTGVGLPDSTSITYAYDADGHRIQQNANGQITNYLWDELSAYGDVIAESDNFGNVTASYVLGNGRLISQNRGGVESYYLFDAMSVRNLADSSSAITDSYSYTAFGEVYSQSGATINPYRYAGQYLDLFTGLYNLRGRYYAPGYGRFLSRDTYRYNFRNPRELNRYGYVGNNPILYADPTGLQASGEYGGVNFQSSGATSSFTYQLGRGFIEGAVAGGLGYIVGIMAYSAAASLLKYGDFKHFKSEFQLAWNDISFGFAIAAGGLAGISFTAGKLRSDAKIASLEEWYRNPFNQRNFQGANESNLRWLVKMEYEQRVYEYMGRQTFAAGVGNTLAGVFTSEDAKEAASDIVIGLIIAIFAGGAGGSAGIFVDLNNITIAGYKLPGSMVSIGVNSAINTVLTLASQTLDDRVKY